MTGGSTGGYREKYLRALEEQERLEKQFDVQLEFLRKTVIHLSAAAHGLDKQLDAEMLALKDSLRGAKGAQVIEKMERVQRAVTSFEKSRDAENSAAARAMNTLIEHYLTLRLTPDIRQRLLKFNSGVKKALHSYRIYPAVLAEVMKLQQEAFDCAAEPPKSLWQRIKPGRQIHFKEDVDEANVLEGTVIERDEEVPQKINAESVKEIEIEPLQRKLSDDEDSYEQVAARISATLEELIEKIQPNAIIKHKVDIVRTRIRRGMDWFALAVTLEDLRDILLLRYLDVDREFSNYLKQVNEELVSISKVLGLAVDRETEQRDAAGAFSERVSSQVAQLRSSMESSENIDELKTEVKTHLEQIQDALAQFNDSQHTEVSDGSLTEQLKALVNRVQSIEKESVKTKELLEEERYKATHDSLTALPNREAYNERAYLELQRFKRYGHPLCLAVCDVDHFKSINDNYGHQAGDKILKLIARVLSTRLRKVDFVARYGGEEFVILLPETSGKQALAVLEKIRKAIGKSAFRFKDSPVNITISFGIAPLDIEDSVESAFARADEALYQAKDQGRNRCVVAPSGSE